MLLLQAHDLAATADAAHQGGWHPTAFWLIALLPLIGFLINGTLALIAARQRAAHALVPAQAHDASEAEQHADVHLDHPAVPGHGHEPEHAHGHDDHAHDDHGHEAPRGLAQLLPSFVAPGVMVGAFVLALVNYFGMLGAELHEPIVETYWSWMPVGDLQIDAAFQIDQLSMVMTLIITGVGMLIHLFSVGYMRQDPGYARYMAYLNLFVFFMLVLVLGSSFPLMFVGWEGVGLCSYLLIGFWFHEKANADAGKKAFIVNRIGDFGFLVAMFMIFWHLGALDFVGAFAEAPDRLVYGGVVVTAICLFLFLGAAGKSAQIPLYVWLPDAMAGPTPVSALIHAATMVTAGVYLVARASTLFAMAPSASLVVALVGALTAIFAASVGLKQWDIKKVLAYSTVSQLGFMFVAVGLGAYATGVFHLMTHAFFKACLFLGSGAVIHAMHHALHATHNGADAQDMRNMGGLAKYMPITFATMGVSTLAIAGVPPFAGFFSKEEIIAVAKLGAGGYSPFSDALLFGIEGRYWMGFIYGTLTIAAFMTAFYMGRMMIYTFFGPNRTGSEERKHLHEVGWPMTVPLLVLGALSVVGGLLNVEREVPIVNLFDFGQGAALHGWLHPAVAGAEAVWADAGTAVTGYVPHPAWPVVLAILVGLGGLAAAWFLLRPAKLGTETTEPAYQGGLQKALYNKWYVDEVYDATVVKPVWSLSRAFSSVVDKGIIDGIVDGAGRMAQSVGLVLGRAQTGQVNTYAFVIVLGVLAVLAGFSGFFDRFFGL
jgi:NADH-quinone oxidoreductase subunit L